MTVILIILVLSLGFLLALSGRNEEDRFNAFKGVPIAHRGFHTMPEAPENSIPAFKRAVEHGYGIELDLHLLSDGTLAVFHDDTLIRMTGVEGRIKELTADELKNYRLGGTAHTIPTFTQFLELVDGRVPLIIELKAEGNVPELCRATLDALSDYKGDFVIESFHPRVLIWLRKNCPKITRGQLSQNFLADKKNNLCLPLKAVLTTLFLNIFTKPDFVAFNYNHRNNIFNRICTKFWKIQPVLWTITNTVEYETAKNEGAIIIFEGFEAEA